MMFFFSKQKTAYEMRISDWSSYVCFFRSDSSVDEPVRATDDNEDVTAKEDDSEADMLKEAPTEPEDQGYDPKPAQDIPDKYWDQRYRYFSRYDHGIELDVEGWYSVSVIITTWHAQGMGCTCLRNVPCAAS